MFSIFATIGKVKLEERVLFSEMKVGLFAVDYHTPTIVSHVRVQGLEQLHCFLYGTDIQSDESFDLLSIRVLAIADKYVDTHYPKHLPGFEMGSATVADKITTNCHVWDGWMVVPREENVGERNTESHMLEDAVGLTLRKVRSPFRMMCIPSKRERTF